MRNHAGVVGELGQTQNMEGIQTPGEGRNQTRLSHPNDAIKESPAPLPPPPEGSFVRGLIHVMSVTFRMSFVCFNILII